MSHTWRFLAANVVRPSDATTQAAHLRAMATQGIDWQELLGLARRHQVIALLQESLEKHLRDLVPPEIASKLAQQARAVRLRSLVYSAHRDAIAAQFAHVGIAGYELKGHSLSRRLFGDGHLRQSIDIDLLVRPQDLSGAVAALVRCGFVPQAGEPLGDSARHQLRRRLEYHCMLRHAQDRVAVELHWRLKGWSPDVTPAESVTPGNSLRTLPAALEMVDLINHGTGHYWCLLKWLADIRQATLLYPQSFWDSVRHTASELKATAAVHITALLVSWVYSDEHVFESLTGTPRPSWPTTRAAKIALGRLLAANAQPRGLDHSLRKAAYTLFAATPHRTFGLGWRFMTSTGLLNLSSGKLKPGKSIQEG